MINQRTLGKTLFFSGIGLHGGENANVRIKPADEDQGIIFKRVDADHYAEIPADLEHIKQINYSITLGENGLEVRTVEHLLAALAGMKIDNATVELDGPEIPGMDGSAKPLVDLLSEAGTIEQTKPKQFIKIKRPIEASIDGKFAMILPYPEQKISYTICFDHPVLGKQHISFIMNDAYFTKQIASARTFGFLKDAEAMSKLGLARGVSLDNSIVIGEKRILNEKLRYKDEFVRHKVLDFIGDISLAGRPIIGHLIALKSGHYMNTRLCKKLLEETGSWTLIDGKGLRETNAAEERFTYPELVAETV